MLMCILCCQCQIDNNFSRWFENQYKKNWGFAKMAQIHTYMRKHSTWNYVNSKSMSENRCRVSDSHFKVKSWTSVCTWVYLKFLKIDRVKEKKRETDYIYSHVGWQQFGTHCENINNNNNNNIDVKWPWPIGKRNCK